ncbi:metal transporter [Halobacteriales archaeon QH_10_67_13]|nr:MAG: metal transporter [Halobacteriales archaeon QH_10_67_13]
MPASWRWRVLWALCMVALLVTLYTIVYQELLRLIADESVSLAHSLQVVIEALTTAGFGGDTDLWGREGVVLNLMIIAMNLTGVLLVFMAVPGFLIPLLQRRLTNTPPQSTNLTDHVIICSYSQRIDTLIAELETASIPYIVIAEDPDEALELNDDGTNAMYGIVDRKRTLEAANAELARALVTNVGDERSATVVLTAKAIDEELRVVSVAESEDDAVYHRYAGTDKVIRPRRLLGYSLGKRAARAISRQLQSAIQLDDDIEISEVVVDEDSPLAGQTLGGAAIREQIVATVIGVWSRGEFTPAPGPEVRIEDNAILLVAGSSGNLEGVAAQTSSRGPRGGNVIVAGHGEVGRAAIEAIEDVAGVEYRIIDREDGPAVDIVGDASDEETLAATGLEDAESVVLALDDDATMIRATLVLERLAPEVEVIARVNDRENESKLYRAGAEYVLAVSTVTGRMLASALTEDEVLSPESQVRMSRTRAATLGGTTLAEARIRERTGVTVVAVEREDDVIADPAPGFELRADDELIVAGSDEAMSAFLELTE